MKIYFLSIIWLLWGFSFSSVQGQVTLNLKFFIQGYYAGSGTMKPVLSNQLVNGATLAETDTVQVQLRATTNPYSVIELFKGVLMTDGFIVCIYSNAVNGGSYYIAVKHRSMVETWSSAPVMMTALTNYDFTTAANMAYADNLLSESPGAWSCYNGNINQDTNIDLIDFPIMDFGINQGLYGYYAADLNGDGNVDLFDFVILNNNLNAGVFCRKP